MRRFWTADLHLGHGKIIEHEERPWKTVKEHDEALISIWNSQVRSSKDHVYILGDMFWKGNTNKAIRCLSQMNGIKHLIQGNHDKVCRKERVRQYFSTITPMLELTLQVPPDNKKQLIVLCHYSLRTWNKRKWGSWHLHGHSHGKMPPLGKSFDVGISTNNYRLLTLEDIAKKMEELPK